MALASLFFSSMTLLVKLGGKRFPVFELVFVRSLVSLVIAGWVLRRAGIPRWGHNRRLLFLRGAFGMTALCCYFFAVTHLPLAEATVIQFTNPLFTALMAALILNERLYAYELGCALLSLAGVALVARPGHLFSAAAMPLDLLALGVALGGAVLSAAAYTSVRKLRETDHPMVVVWYLPLVSTPMILPLAVRDWVWPTLAEWLLLAAIGVFAQLGQIHMTRSLHLETAARATAVSYLQIAFAIGLGLAVFRETPAWSTLVGAALVIAGTLALAARRGRGAAGTAAREPALEAATVAP